MRIDFDAELKRISSLREEKGSEEKTILEISKLQEKATKSKKWGLVAKLHWESHLVWQHKVMAEISKIDSLRNPQLIKEGKEKMLEYAMSAKEVIELHKLTRLKGLAYRFLGRSMSYLDNFVTAKEYYETSINNFAEDDKARLEINGFLSDTLIRLGSTKDGVHLAKRTYVDFHRSELGLKLKSDDYYTWAVWMSGIAPRVCSALLETGSIYNREELISWLNETLSELQHPTNEITWGDTRFEFRVDEINGCLKKLN